MYKLHLILKYLRKRRIAWVSLVAVTLCTAMVIVVISVMGGWLRMFRESFHGLSGDIIVRTTTVVGFPHYEQMIQRIEALPGVEAAVPTVQTFALIDVRNYIYEIVEPVKVIGYDLEEIVRVNDFEESLYRQGEVRQQVMNEALASGELTPEQQARTAELLNRPPTFDLLPNIDYERMYRRIAPNSTVNPRSFPGMIVGAGVVGIRKDRDGNILRPEGLYEALVKLTMLGIDPDTKSIDMGDKSEAYFWIVDDSRTKVYQYDANTVYVPFDVLQKELKMDAYEGAPARATTIEIKVRDGVDMYGILPDIKAIVASVFADNQIRGRLPEVETWEEANAVWIGAVEKEKALVTILFGIVSIVAVFLIFCIFYMIVVEKTKDIGIIKSVGATGGGVAGIFLGYGLAIGIVGGAAGLLVGYLIVSNINELHTAMANLTGAPIWNPEVYAFDTIPNTMNPWEVAVIVTVAVVSSVLGSLVPAIRAARMHPVEALRWE